MTVAIVCTVSSCTPNHVNVLNTIPPTIALMNGLTLSSKAGCWEIPSGPDFQEGELGLMEPSLKNQTSTKTKKDSSPQRVHFHASLLKNLSLVPFLCATDNIGLYIGLYYRGIKGYIGDI